MVLIGSVALFGVATIAIGFSQGVMGIVILRFLAGLGIGGALPSASTMTAEFAPARSRTMAVTLTIVCYPLGGMLAGLFAGAILPTLGWRASSCAASEVSASSSVGRPHRLARARPALQALEALVAVRNRLPPRRPPAGSAASVSSDAA